MKPVRIGVSDGEYVEILSGLTSGQPYVSENSFLIKADILKSGAAHEH
jgi:cobalt-zinc-cadmium efflux system membrane fusion protein